jgi:hypothetical protein
VSGAFRRIWVWLWGVVANTDTRLMLASARATAARIVRMTGPSRARGVDDAELGV